MSTENKPTHSIREFKLSTLSLKNRTSVLILTFIVAVFGVLSYTSMPKELFPEIVFPQIYVSTVYPGNSPLDIENLITRPLEKEIKPIKGIKVMRSTSVQDYSAILVEFNPDVDVEEALQDVKDAVDKAKKELPTDLDSDPSVMDIDFSEFPVMNVNLSGDYSIDDLKEYAEYLQDEIEEVPQISKVELKGALEREIVVSVDLHKIEPLQISLNDIENAIAYENMSISGGDLLADGSRRTVRVVGEFNKVEDIENIVVKHEHGNVVYMRDIATVKDSYKERNSFARLDGDPVVSLDVIKKGGENLLMATDEIFKIIEKAEKEKFPSDLHITVTNDQSEQTRDQLLNLENSIYSGVILVVLVLQFFLGLRNAMFVGIAIPMSMLTSFMVMSIMGVSINMMVLFSLILALGMLVDNAIVVIENIYRLFHEEGYSAFEAARQGVGEVAVPIISSTATTVAAFFPLLFWDSIMGEFMKYLPITLIIVLSSSLFVGLVINPVVTAMFMKKGEETKKPNYRRLAIFMVVLAVLSGMFYALDVFAFGTVFALIVIITLANVFLLSPASKWFQNVFLTRLEIVYSKVLTYALAGFRPWMVLLLTFVILILTNMFFASRNLDVVQFPVTEPKYVNIFIEMPMGTDIYTTDSVAKLIEVEVNEIIEPDSNVIRSVVTNVGQGSSDPMDGPSMGETPNKARITVSFVEFQYRGGKNTSDIMKALTAGISKRPGVFIAVDKNREGPPTGKPINIEVTGENFEQLLAIVTDVRSKIEAAGIEGIEGFKVDLDATKPELLVDIDRAKARRFGLSTGQIGGAIRTSLFGKEVSKFKDGEDDYPIMLKLKDEQRYNAAALLNERITFRDQSTGKIVQVPISAVANIKYNTSYGSVKRKDMDRAVTLYSNVIEGFNETKVVDQIRAEMKGYTLPEGYTIKFTGSQEEQANSMAFLMTAMMMAVALIALILVSQFNSGIKPFIIIMAVVFSTIGVFLGLAVFKMDFVVMMTGIGIVSLAGIVVNNAIVLIDYIDLLRARKREELGYEEGQSLPLPLAIECIIQAGKTRLRPVLLTAITTVLGLIPLAIGLNINFYTIISELDAHIYLGGDNVAFWGPMSWTIIFGLTFATFLTLVVVPAMYLLAEKVKLGIASLSGKVA